MDEVLSDAKVPLGPLNRSAVKQSLDFHRRATLLDAGSASIMRQCRPLPEISEEASLQFVPLWADRNDAVRFGTPARERLSYAGKGGFR